MPVFGLGLPSGIEWIAILVIVLLLFGVGRLPQVFEAVGKGIKNFKDAQRDTSLDVTPKNRELGRKLDVSEAEEVKDKARTREG